MFKGFRDFVLRGNVVDLAVAVVLGTAFTRVITALVESFLTPLIAAVGGKHDFSDLAFMIHGSRFGYGDFINAFVTFVIIAAVMFFLVIKPVNALLERLRPEPAVDQETRSCPECLSDIPTGARRCAFCTAQVGAAA